jgi:hypothetical protein
MRTWGLDPLQQEQVWEYWRQGDSLRKIARQLSHEPGSIRLFLQNSGGVRRQPRRQANRCISLLERASTTSTQRGTGGAAHTRRSNRPPRNIRVTTGAGDDLARPPTVGAATRGQSPTVRSGTRMRETTFISTPRTINAAGRASSAGGSVDPSRNRP